MTSGLIPASAKKPLCRAIYIGHSTALAAPMSPVSIVSAARAGKAAPQPIATKTAQTKCFTLIASPPCAASCARRFVDRFLFRGFGGLRFFGRRRAAQDAEPQPRQIGQAEKHDLRLAAGGQHGTLAFPQIDRRERAIIVFSRLARAGDDEIKAAPLGVIRRAGRKPQEARLAAPLGKDTQELLFGSGRALDLGPGEIRRIHQDGRGVAALGINHRAAIDVLPDRLETIEIALAGHAFLAAIDTLLEFA